MQHTLSLNSLIWQVLAVTVNLLQRDSKPALILITWLSTRQCRKAKASVPEGRGLQQGHVLQRASQELRLETEGSVLENEIKYAQSITEAPEGHRSGASCCILKCTHGKLNCIEESVYRCSSTFSSMITSTMIFMKKENHFPEELVCFPSESHIRAFCSYHLSHSGPSVTLWWPTPHDAVQRPRANRWQQVPDVNVRVQPQAS